MRANLKQEAKASPATKEKVTAAYAVLTGALPDATADADFSHSPTSGWDSSKTSPAVLDNANQAVRNYAAKKRSGHLTAADVEVAAAAMKTTFDHLQEIGLNDATEKKLLANQDAFANYHPGDKQIQTIQKNLASQGVQFSVSKVRTILDTQYADRQQFLTLVKNQGLYKTELQLVAQFRTNELQFVSESTGVGVSLASHHPKIGNPRVVRTMWYEFASCIIAAAVGLSTGCTITIFACEAAVLLCGACALACGD